MTSGRTGVIEVNGSRQVTLKFSAVTEGEFEQDLYLVNLKDSSEQTHLSLKATVVDTSIVSISLPEDAEKKFHLLHLGLLHIIDPYGDNSADIGGPDAPPPRFVYKFSITNVSPPTFQAQPTGSTLSCH